MNILKQSTAVDVLIGPFVDSTDGDTEETALTISASDVKLSKNGQTMAGKNDATACAHDANGMYNCELDATDTNTVGTLVLFVHESGALAVRHEFQIVEEAIYDGIFASGATAVALDSKVDTIDTNVDAILVDTGTTLDAKLDTIDANVDSILVDTAEIGTAGAGLTDLGGMSTAMKAEVNTECDTALTDYDPPTKAELDSAVSPLATSAAIAALNDLSASDVGNLVIETNGSVTLKQFASVALSVLAGVTSDSGATLKDPSGTTTRVSATVNASNERTAMTLTPSS